MHSKGDKGIYICPQGAGPLLQTGGPNRHRVETETGRVRITEYQVFPGIWVALKEAQTLDFSHHAGYPGGLLEITHCRAGRLEYQAGDRFFYLGEGDMAIHQSSDSQAMFRCPTGRFWGVSVIIHPEIAPRCTSCLLQDVDVDLPQLHRKFCGGDRQFILRSTPGLANVFSQIYAVPEPYRKGYFKVKVLELLLFLSYLEPSQSQAGQRSYTKAQVQLAKQVFAYVREHRNRRLTAEMLAAQFHVSPEQLQRSVKNVYGKTLYQCIRAYKMQMAAAQLLETDRTVMDIASEVGYDNSSKFAKAFLDVVGVSPAQYRQQGHVENGGTDFGAKKG